MAAKSASMASRTMSPDRDRMISGKKRPQRFLQCPEAADRMPREKMAPLWVLTPPVAANMDRSALTPTGRMAANKSGSPPSHP